MTDAPATALGRQVCRRSAESVLGGSRLSWTSKSEVGQWSKAIRDRVIGLAAVGPVRPEEIADAIVSLATEQSSFVHGAVLCVDGGQRRLSLTAQAPHVLALDSCSR